MTGIPIQNYAPIVSVAQSQDEGFVLQELCHQKDLCNCAQEPVVGNDYR